MASPDMMGKEFEDEEMIKQELEGLKDPFEEKYDHKEDKTAFEVALVNTRNEATSIDCAVSNGQIVFNRVRVYQEDGLNRSQQTWLDKTLKRQSEYRGAKFSQLSEPLQNSLVKYLYEAGVHPEIAICLEYLSWNKE